MVPCAKPTGSADALDAIARTASTDAPPTRCSMPLYKHRLLERVQLLQVAPGDRAAGEGELDEARPLAVLRQVLDAEALEERADVRLDPLDAQEQLLRDLLVARGRGALRAPAVGLAQGDEHAALRGADHRWRAAADAAGLRQARARRAEAEGRASEAHDVAVAQAQPGRHPLAVDERPVARETVVDDRPVGAESLELGMHARDLLVPREADVGLGGPAERQPLGAAGQRHDPLGAVSRAEHEERMALALGVQLVLELGRRRPVPG